jgi:hypothetical protein
MSKRRHPRRRTSGERYAMLPDEVLRHVSYTSLPYYARAVLTTIAGQYSGINNGDLCCTWNTAKTYGIRSKQHLVKGLALLLSHRLIVKTKQGGKKPLGPCLYALTWQPIHERRGGYDFGINPCEATHVWLNWTPTQDGNGTTGGPDTAHRRDCRWTGSGPQVVPLDPVSGPQVVPSASNIGTTGSPPSEISPGGPSKRLQAVRA